MRSYMLRRYHDRRSAAIDFLGGKCVECATEDDLELDHIDPSKKSMSISRMWSVSEERFWLEVQKCQLLCGVHHNLKTLKERGLEPVKGMDVHGTLSSYRYCRCELCRAAMNRYQRERKRMKRKREKENAGR